MIDQADLVDELRGCAIVYLAAQSPTPRMMAGEDAPTILAYEEDPILEVIEFATMNGIRVSRDADEDHEAVLVVRTENWKKSPRVTRAVMRAQRSRTPVYFVVPGSLRITRGS